MLSGYVISLLIFAAFILVIVAVQITRSEPDSDLEKNRRNSKTDVRSSYYDDSSQEGSGKFSNGGSEKPPQNNEQNENTDEKEEAESSDRVKLNHVFELENKLRNVEESMRRNSDIYNTKIDTLETQINNERKENTNNADRLRHLENALAAERKQYNELQNKLLNEQAVLENERRLHDELKNRLLNERTRQVEPAVSRTPPYNTIPSGQPDPRTGNNGQQNQQQQQQLDPRNDRYGVHGESKPQAGNNGQQTTSSSNQQNENDRYSGSGGGGTATMSRPPPSNGKPDPEHTAPVGRIKSSVTGLPTVEQNKEKHSPQQSRNEQGNGVSSQTLSVVTDAGSDDNKKSTGETTTQKNSVPIEQRFVRQDEINRGDKSIDFTTLSVVMTPEMTRAIETSVGSSNIANKHCLMRISKSSLPSGASKERKVKKGLLIGENEKGKAKRYARMRIVLNNGDKSASMVFKDFTPQVKDNVNYDFSSDTVTDSKGCEWQNFPVQAVYLGTEKLEKIISVDLLLKSQKKNDKKNEKAKPQKKNDKKKPNKKK